MFKQFHIRYIEISVQQFNEHLKRTNDYKTVDMSYEEYYELIQKSDIYKVQPKTRFFKQNRIKQTLTYKMGKRWFSFMTKLDTDYKRGYYNETSDPIKSYRIFSRMVKPIDYSKYKELLPDMKAYHDNHPDKAGHYDYAICYDVNKSYLNACKNKMPTEMIDRLRKPRKNEVGFTSNGFPVIGPSNMLCNYIFKFDFIKGLANYVNRYESLLKTAENSEIKQYYKDQINHSIGNLRNHNPFLRNMIVWYSNEFIISKVDENTIWSNTDSIVSTVKRNDLELGSEVGQFKIQHEGEYRQTATGYQWVNDTFSNKGVSNNQVKIFKKVMGREFILGEDSFDMLHNMNIWEYNYETKRYRKKKY